MRSVFRTSLPLLLVLASVAAAQAQTEQPDNYTWLEDVYGKRSMDWVNAHNEASAKILQADPRFAQLKAEALQVLQSPDRLAMPDIHGNAVYNFWQDKSHVRGILRRTTLKDYLSKQPHWNTVLDYDALGKQDNKSWVNAGLVRLESNQRLALVGLSEGGEDAHIYREFDLQKMQFVENGFTLPRAKSDVAWIDKDHLLVTTEWGKGSLTASGYPYITKLWTRGTPLDSAKELYRGTQKDVGVGSLVLHDGQGHQANFVVNNRTFFESEFNMLNNGKMMRVALPPRADITGLVNNHLIVALRQDWTTAGKSYPQGSVLSLNLPDVRKDGAHLKPMAIFTPTKSEFEQDAQATKDGLVLATLDNVRGRAYMCTVDKHGKWHRKALPLPDNLDVSIASANPTSDSFFLSTAGFITPNSLYLCGGAGAYPALIKSRKPQFDASNLMVEQLWATSKDGTKIPYFIVHRKNMKYDGSNATLLEAYGGFQVSQTPFYSGARGKLWLEKGGVYVLANIRGGGEFGPAWHEAGLKTHRQRIYDDFYAVGKDLVDRKITSTKHLGIEGGSNGGLLMGVEMTQHPEMWNAVVIEVPLLDMLGFEHIAAGASWVDEYGSISVPAERKFLATISPYNQLRKDVDYPEPLIFTTTKDDRVGPVHARKFAARMEEFGKPFFYDEITEGGHSAGADLTQQATTDATIFTYLMEKLMG